jgi:hypothetical protein
VTRRRRPTAQELHRRLDALSSGVNGPLSAAERAELDQLQAEYDREFSGAIETWSDATLEAFFKRECADPDGKARRHFELRQRARSPEQVERDRIEGERIAAMTDAEIEAYLNAHIHGPKGPTSWNR